MSNLSAHRPANYRLESFLPKNLGFEEESLFTSGYKGRNYGETDWTDVPKIDYASGEFNQLSIPEPAEVVEDGDEGGEFVLDDLDSLRQMGKRGLGDSANSGNSGEHAGENGESGQSGEKSKHHSQARALTLELVKTKYKVQDLGQSERLARAKLKNPQAHSNADQPFIPTYGESRKALLRKLGFSDDYELSLSGTPKPDKNAKSNHTSVDDTEDASRANAQSPRGPIGEGLNDSEEFHLGGEHADKNLVSDSESAVLGGEDAKDLAAKGGVELDGNESQDIEPSPDGAEKPFEELDTKAIKDAQEDFAAPDVPADEAKLAIEKAYEEGFQKGLLEAKEKALVQESLQTEIAEKEEQKRIESQQAREAQMELQREKERKEYENEIQNLKDKIKSFDESLLGELEKKKEQLDKEMQPKVKVLTDLCDQLKELTEDSQSFFEPLKRLSVHIAEQLVLGELSASSAVVQRLIQRCIDELDMRDNPVVQVELNPLDKALLESAAGANLARLKVSAAQNMQVGSVRVSVNDTKIEDLIQNRLDNIASRLLGQPQEWRDHSTLMRRTKDQSYFDASQDANEVSEVVDSQVNNLKVNLQEQEQEQEQENASNNSQNDVYSSESEIDQEPGAEQDAIKADSQDPTAAKALANPEHNTTLELDDEEKKDA